MKPYEKIKENEKIKWENALSEDQKNLNKERANNAMEYIIKIYEEGIQHKLDNLENLDDVTINVIAHECKSIIKSMQSIHEKYLNDYYSEFDDLMRFHFGNTSTDNYYGKKLLSESTHHIRLGNSDLADFDDLRNCFSGKNPYDENVIEGWINYVNACYGTNLISDAQFNRIKEEYDKNRADDEMYVKYRDAERNAGKLSPSNYLFIHDERYLQAKENTSNLSL